MLSADLCLRVGETCFLISVIRRGKLRKKILGDFDWRFHVTGCKIPSDLFRASCNDFLYRTSKEYLLGHVKIGLKE